MTRSGSAAWAGAASDRPAISASVVFMAVKPASRAYRAGHGAHYSRNVGCRRRHPRAKRGSHAPAMRALLLVMLLAAAATVDAADLSKPLILVAAPELHDPVYGATVIVVAPL